MRYRFPASSTPGFYAIFDGNHQIYDSHVTRGFPDPTVPHYDEGFTATMMIGQTQVILWAPTTEGLSEKIDNLLNG